VQAVALRCSLFTNPPLILVHSVQYHRNSEIRRHTSRDSDHATEVTRSATCDVTGHVTSTVPSSLLTSRLTVSPFAFNISSTFLTHRREPNHSSYSSASVSSDLKALYKSVIITHSLHSNGLNLFILAA